MDIKKAPFEACVIKTNIPTVAVSSNECANILIIF